MRPRPRPFRPLSWALLLVFLGLGGCVTTPALKTSSSSSSSFTWSLRLLPGGDTAVGAVETRLCFVGAPPAHVGPENPKALPWLMDLPRPVDAQGRELGPPLQVDDQGIVTSGLKDGGCLAFSVDIEAAAQDINDRDVAAVVGRSILSSPDAWLWRPHPWPAGAVGRLQVEGLGAQLVVPFVRDDDGSYQVPASTFALQCFAALGDVEVDHLSFADVTLRVARVEAGGVDDDTLAAWLRTAVDDVAGPLQRFPVSELLVLLVPVAGRREVAAGFLGRGGGSSALFFLGRGPFVRDPGPDPVDEDGRWVLTHELAHALLPPVVRGDGWLNEGLTTWHQEVLPALAGRRLRASAQAQLELGFRTGRARAAEDGLSVEDSCRQMDARGTYQHCYWAGARLMDLLAQEVGDDGVLRLVRALYGAGPTDGPPQPALTLLHTAQASTDAPTAAAARVLLRLWSEHKRTSFPDPAVVVSVGDPG